MEKDRELEGKEILQYRFLLEKHAFRRHKLWLWHLLVWPMADPFGKLYGPNWWCEWYRTCIISIHRIKYIAMVFLRQLNSYSTLKTSHTRGLSLATTHTTKHGDRLCYQSSELHQISDSQQSALWLKYGGREVSWARSKTINTPWSSISCLFHSKSHAGQETWQTCPDYSHKHFSRMHDDDAENRKYWLSVVFIGDCQLLHRCHEASALKRLNKQIHYWFFFLTCK